MSILYSSKKRMDWLKGGDLNIKFFPDLVRVKQVRNRIQVLRLLYGTICENQDYIKEALMSFYIDILGSPKERVHVNPLIS